MLSYLQVRSYYLLLLVPTLDISSCRERKSERELPSGTQTLVWLLPQSEITVARDYSKLARYTLSTTASTNRKSVPENLPSSLCFWDHSLVTASHNIQFAFASTSSSPLFPIYRSTTAANNATLSLICTFKRASYTIMIRNRYSAIDWDSKKRSIRSGWDFSTNSSTLAGFAGIRFNSMRTT